MLQGQERFPLGRSIVFSAIISLAILAGIEGTLRLVGVKPPVRPRILLRALDVDIEFPFMRPDPDTFWSPKPGFRGEFLGQLVSINSLGLRGNEVARPKPQGRTRIVCFGDSITFGYGVGDDDTYCAVLGRELADRGVETVNAGVTGFTSHQVLAWLERLAPALEADAAVFCIGWNDGTRRALEDREYERRLRASLAVESLFDRLYIYRAMKRIYVASAMKPARPGPEARRRVPLEEYKTNLARIVSLCRANGIAPAFVKLPHRRQPGSNAAIPTDYALALAAAGRATNTPVFDSGILAYDAAVEDTSTLFIDSLHLSPAGHKVLARELARQLEPLLLDPHRGVNRASRNLTQS